MIPQHNLSRLSNRLARQEGQRIPESVLERNYCLAWFLVALSRTPLSKRLAFKGGTALKQCYFGDYRFSEDLDFTLIDEVAFDVIRQGLETLFAEAKRASGITLHFLREDRHSHSNSYTFYLGYEGPLPVSAGGKEIKVDITLRECLVFPLADQPVLRCYEEYSDLPRNAKIHVYSLDEIATEKVVALIDRARNEPRDLYDFWYLTTDHRVHLGNLLKAIRKKLEFRGRKLTDIRKELLTKKPRYKKLWDIRLASQMVELPQFETVYRAVQRALRQVELLKKR